MWLTCTREYCSALERDGILTRDTTWMYHGDIVGRKKKVPSTLLSFW